MKDKVDVLIKYTDKQKAIKHITEAEGKVKREYKHFPMMSATISKGKLKQLMKHTDIKVELDGEAEILDEELERSWSVKQVGAGILHEQGITGQGVKVAIIDTGIDYNNPELAPAYRGGWDFFNNDNDPADDNGHGSHVAGIIAAAKDGMGVVGGAPGVELYIFKAFSANGSGQYSTIIAAIDLSIEYKVDIINNSYGGSTYNALLEMVFQAASDAGIILIAAAGNSGGTPPEETTKYPARFPCVIAVAATDINKTRAYFSSVGPATEVSAPGVDILSCELGDALGKKSGTSMSCPHVVFTAALMKSVHPDWDNETIRGQLRASAEGSPDHDWLYGFGPIDAVKACGELIPNPPPMPPLPLVPLPPEVITNNVFIHENGKTVTFYGELISMGNSDTVEAYFYYGITPEWGYTIATPHITKTQPGFYSITKELQTGYNYKCYACAVGIHGRKGYGNVLYFTLDGTPPPQTVELTMKYNLGGMTIPTPGTHEYPKDSIVDIKAIPGEDWQFDNWTGDVFDHNSASTTVVMDISQTVTANFSLLPIPQPTKMVVSDFTASSLTPRRVILKATVADEYDQPVKEVALAINGTRLNKRGKPTQVINWVIDTDGDGFAYIQVGIKFGTWQFRVESVTKEGYNWAWQDLVRTVNVKK